MAIAGKILFLAADVYNLVTYQCYGKTVIDIVVKLSKQVSDGTEIMLLNSPGGSTLQWVMVRVCFVVPSITCVYIVIC